MLGLIPFARWPVMACGILLFECDVEQPAFYAGLARLFALHLMVQLDEDGTRPVTDLAWRVIFVHHGIQLFAIGGVPPGAIKVALRDVRIDPSPEDGVDELVEPTGRPEVAQYPKPQQQRSGGEQQY